MEQRIPPERRADPERIPRREKSTQKESPERIPPDPERIPPERKTNPEKIPRKEKPTQNKSPEKKSQPRKNPPGKKAGPENPESISQQKKKIYPLSVGGNAELMTVRF